MSRYLLIPTLTPEMLRNLSPQAAKLLLLFCQVKTADGIITADAPTLAHYVGRSRRALWSRLAELHRASLIERLPRLTRTSPNRYRLTIVNRLPAAPPPARTPAPDAPNPARRPTPDAQLSARRPNPTPSAAPENAHDAPIPSLQHNTPLDAQLSALRQFCPDILDLARTPEFQRAYARVCARQAASAPHPETAP